MGFYNFRLPDVGEGVAEAEIVVWHVKPGDKISEDDSLVDIMTDKATVDMSSPVDGVVKAIHGDVGDRMPVGAVLVEIETIGGFDDDLPDASVVEVTTPEPQIVKSSKPETDIVLAAPATRKKAKELGVSLQIVPGTGPDGRVTPEDLETFVQAATSKAERPTAPAKSAPQEGVHIRKIIGLRRKIAEKMELSARNIPHFTYVEECDMTELEQLRVEMNKERRSDQPKLTILPFFMLALTRLRTEFPQINARFDDESGELHEFDALHVGIAAQTKNGLLAPVVRHVETLDIWSCASEVNRVAEAARKGSLTPQMLSGSTITLTSLGALGGVSATPIINTPEVAIVGPNRIVERPVVMNGQIVVRKMMNISSSFDHRIVDGHDAASFIQRIKRLLETPALLFA